MTNPSQQQAQQGVGPAPQDAYPPQYSAQAPYQGVGQGGPRQVHGAPGYPAAYGQRPGYPPRPSRPGSALGRVAGGLLLVATILAIVERVVWGRMDFFHEDFWYDAPLYLVCLAAIGSAIVLLIGVRAPAAAVACAAGSGMLFATGLTPILAYGRFFGMASVPLLVLVLSILANLAALVLAVISAAKTGRATTPTQPPARWGQQPMSPQQGQWGQQPVSPQQYLPPQ
ncbi:hypothetical protein [Nocardia sp. XZ_19_385]|uniref:hypothetical protein n=1 Tax=Nocardia sp. XZ_19_385 TaxID=2769488 RepID=UPI00188FC84B|nr:hypothetical protein [Nocardia sp. XZ_19_385]